jgi:hypothetical protein
MSTHGEAVEDIKKAKSVLDAGKTTVTNKIFTHTSVSMVKSGFRILAGLALCFGDFVVAGALLIVAELLGIAEELV